MREIVAESEFDELHKGTYSARLLDAARPKFNTQVFNGRVKGYGKVLLR